MRLRLLLWHKMTILLAASVILLTLGVALATFLSLRQAKDKVEVESSAILARQTELFLEKIAAEHTGALDAQLAQARDAAGYGAGLLGAALQDGNIAPDLAKRALSSIFLHTEHCSRAYCLSEAGWMQVFPPLPAGMALPEGFDIRKEPFFPPPAAYAGESMEPVWTKTHANPLADKQELSVDAIAPVRDGAGRIRGYVGLAISLSSIVTQLNQFQPIRGSYSFVTNADFELIAAPPQARVELSSPANFRTRGIIDLRSTDNPELARFFRNMALGESTLKVLDLRGQRMYLACHPFRTLPWRLGLAVPERMITAASSNLAGVVDSGSRQALWGMAAWTATFFVLTLVGGVLFARRLSSPLQEMSRITKEFAMGDFSARLAFSSRDELGALANAFNAMAGKIRVMVADLGAANAALENNNRLLEEEIVERRRAERELSESYERFRMVLDSLDAYVYAADLQTCELLFINKRLEETFGHVVGQPCWKALHAGDGPCAFFTNSRLLDPEGKPTGVYRWELQNKRNGRWYDCRDQAVGWTDGRLVRLEIATDITERKQADEEVRRLRNYLANIIDSMPSVLVAVDPQGKVTLWNHLAEQATGLDAAHMAGRDLAQAFPGLVAEKDLIRQVLDRRQAMTETKVARQAGEEVRYEDITLYPLVANGVEGLVIRIDDVTDRVRIEEMLVQSEKMVSLGGLAAGMAHEINNPLAGILVNVQVIRNRLCDPSPKNLRTAAECGTSLEALSAYVHARDIDQMLTAIREAGSRAAKIVRNMLSFSRDNRSEMKLCSLAELLDSAIELALTDYDLKKHYDFKKIEIAREYESPLPDVLCETSKIQQVYLNLLRNAAEAMFSKAYPQGQGPRFILRACREKDKVRVEVEDNGPGMAEEVRRRVFEPFFTTKPVGMGTGLGLSVSYLIIVTTHNGAISVESSPGQWTRFIIRLPIVGTPASLSLPQSDSVSSPLAKQAP